MVDTTQVGVNDVLPVRSRVSWSALLAGLFVAMTVYLVLGVLGVALGLSFAGQELDRQTIGTTAGIYAVATLLLALFSGGCVAAWFTAGETKAEAIVYGVVLWGVMFAVIVWLAGTGLQAGFGGALRAANVVVGANGGNLGNWEQAARQAGITQEQVDRMRASLPTAEGLRSGSTQAAWWAFGGLIVSLLASILGALVGSGSTPVLANLGVRRTTVVTTPGGIHPTTP